jgi:DNA invertase Pin-like site-specific DNA recombinase
MENCVIYARFSSYGQNEQSIEAQVRICKEFAESKGYKVINIYPDKARTGTNDSRPAFQRMIADAASGAFQYIIVYMFDRFARNRRDSIMYKEMLKEKYSIRVISALEPIAEDEGGEFYEMFLEWNAEKYSKRLSKRVKDGLDTSIANGTFCGGYLIYGYSINHEPVPGKTGKTIKKVILNDEASGVVKYAFEEYDKGIKKKDIVKAINEQGHRYHDKAFTTHQLDNWLNNPKYTGEFTFGGRVCTNMYPQIVSKELYDRVHKRLDKNKYFAGGTATAREPYLLTGKLYCGECGTDMVSDGGTSKSGIQHHYYICKKKRAKKCEKHREEKNSLEYAVTAFVVDWLSDEEHVQIAVDDVMAYYETRTNIKNLKSIETKIANAKKETEELADAFVKAKSALLQNTIEKKMNEYEILLNDLSYQHAMLELERGYKISRKDMIDYINLLIQGDKNDKEYQRKIIDNLVYMVFCADGGTVAFLNIKGGKYSEEISFEDVKDIIENYKKGVQTQLPPARQ